MSLTAFFEALGRAPDEVLSVCSKTDTQKGINVDWVRVDQVEALIASMTDRHVWFNAQPMTRPESGRGKSRDVVGVRALYVDLDFQHDGKPGGVPRGTALEIVEVLSHMLHVDPTVTVATGYGIQPWFTLDELVDPIDGALLLLRWRDLVIQVAGDFGVTVDTQVFDLPRILRMPATNNVKHGTSRPTGLVPSLGGGERLTHAEVVAVLGANLRTDSGLSRANLKWEGSQERSDLGDESGDRAFTEQEALDFLEEQVFSVIRSTPWGAGANFWKVLWERSMLASCFDSMFDEDDLKEGIRQAIRDGHEGVGPDGNDETQIALGFVKGHTFQARRAVANPFGALSDQKVAIETAAEANGGSLRVASKYDGDRTPGKGMAKSIAQLGDLASFPEPIADEFWESRPVLGHIRQAALASLTSPEAVLALVLTDALGHSMPHVGLPKVGDIPGREKPGVSSLNLLTCIVGTPGTGKDEAVGVAKDCVEFITTRRPVVDTIGSGEGIGGTYVSRRAPSELAPKVLELCQHEWLFKAMVSESDTMAQLASRAGNTLLPEIRKAAMGQRLGFKNADRARCYPVEEGTYRFVAVVLAQPVKLAWLFDDDEGGTPQRFLYAFAGNVAAPDVEYVPAWPPTRAINMPVAVVAPGWIDPGFVRFPPGLIQAHHKLLVCDEARRVVAANRLKGQRMEALSDEAHTTLTRLKVAAALSFIDGRAEVAEKDWELSEAVMSHSRAVRIWVEGELSRKAARESVSQGMRQGHQSFEAKKTVASVEADLSAAAGDKIVAFLQEAGPGGETWGKVCNSGSAIRKISKDILDRARAELLADGKIREEEAGVHNGKKIYRLFLA